MIVVGLLVVAGGAAGAYVLITRASSEPLSTSPSKNYEKWLSTEAIQTFKRAGLEAENTSALQCKDIGFAPCTFKEGTRFLIPSLCADCGGRAFSYTSASNKERMRSYYVEAGRASGFLFSWVFEKDNLLIQINGDLPKATAERYNSTLQAMTK